MIKAYLYDAEGHDREVFLEARLPKLSEQQLLWIDVTGREADELAALAPLLGLDRSTLTRLGRENRVLALANYGEYGHFDVMCLAIKGLDDLEIPRVPGSRRIDFIISDLLINDFSCFWINLNHFF